MVVEAVYICVILGPEVTTPSRNTGLKVPVFCEEACAGFRSGRQRDVPRRPLPL